MSHSGSSSNDPVQRRAEAQNPASQALVNVRDKVDRDRWAEALGVTAEALESAVLAVGPRIDAVKDYLTGGSAGRQQDA